MNHETATAVVILIVSAIGLVLWAACEVFPRRRNPYMSPWSDRQPGTLPTTEEPS